MKSKFSFAGKKKSICFLLLSIILTIALSSCMTPGPDSSEAQNVISKGIKYVFGSYEQDGVLENGTENIVWRLVERTDEKMLLISDCVLDTVIPHNEYENVNFKDTEIAKWLESFYQTAFSDLEKECIIEQEGDKVHVPDAGFFIDKHKIDLLCVPTTYAKLRGVRTSSLGGKVRCWWFANCEESGSMISCATDTNEISAVPVNTKGIGIRPMIWVDAVKFNDCFTLTVDGFDSAKMYFVGDSPRQNQLVVSQVMNNNDTVIIEEGYTIYPETFTEEGRQYVTIEYLGQKAVKEVMVYPSIKSVEILTPAQKIFYCIGEKIVTSGLSMKAVLDNGKEVVFSTGFDVEPADATATRGTKTISVGINGKKAEYEIEVLPEVVSLQVNAKYDEYEYGAEFNPADFEVKAVFADGSESNSTRFLELANDSDKQYISSRIQFRYLNASQIVNVTLHKKVTDIHLTNPEQEMYFGHNIPYDATLDIVYSSGYVEQESFALLMNSKILKRNVKGSYSYFILSSNRNELDKYSYDIDLNIPELSKITVTAKDMEVGQIFSLSRGKCRITLTYENGYTETFKAGSSLSSLFSYDVVSKESPKISVKDKPLPKGTYTLKVSVDDHEATTEFEVDGNRYVRVLGHYSWSQAEKFCEEVGGHLATISSIEEQKKVYEVSAGVNCWLGGYYSGGKWKWVTGEPWTFTYWGEGEPNGGYDEPCLAIWPEKWNDLCDNSYEQDGFIIEFDD